MIYAPIVIPTCNRIEHLKRCITSLQVNSWAKYTELYISLDYPPSTKYENGYEKVKKWLQTDIKGFKKIYLYIQPENLGPSQNMYYLLNIVMHKHDRWIMTEDDNEFSKNFIEYMDKGLYMFEDSSEVFAICSSSESTYTSMKYNAYQAQFLQPWGIAVWKNKYLEFLNTKEAIILNPENKKFSNVLNLYFERTWFFRNYINDILCNDRTLYWKNKHELTTIDAVMQLYIYFKNMYCIFPIKCKARTWGNDGSGFTMKKDESIDPLSKWPLDEEIKFEFVMLDNPQIQDSIRKSSNAMYKRKNRKEILKLWGKYMIFCALGKNKNVF